MFRSFSLLSFYVFALSVTAVFAANPNGYYNSLDGKSTQNLKNATYAVINPHTQLTYNSLWTHFKQTDIHAYPNQDQWWDMYSDIIFYVRNGSAGLNREHSFPKSWWGGSQIPPYTDINHLYPSESAANLAKSNYPLGEVNISTFDNGVSKVGYPVSGQGGGASRVFEPADEYKGDFARTYFYMVTCYQNLTWKYLYMLQSNPYPTLQPWAYEMLLKWHREDPVSQKEIDRNEAVYKIQNNRNPFIDFPELAEYIWGNKVGQIFRVDGDEPVGDPTLITPTQGSALDFSEVALGSSQTLNLFFSGKNLRGDITITPYGTDKAMFTPAVKTIPSSLVNSADGYQLSIKYTPTSLGNHTAQILISDGGLIGSFGVVLTGECLPVPVLTAPVALNPQNVTDTGYRAVWEVPGEVVDYYIVTRSVYDNGNVSTNEYIAEENYYDFDDLSLGTMQTYFVQSVRLGYKSPDSNVITVYPGGITGVDAGKGLGIINIDGGVHFICDEPHSNGVVYNMQGQIIRQIETINNGDEILLPYGSYIIKTKEAGKPIKVLIK